MKNEEKKLTHVISEILSYLLCNGAGDVKIDIHHDKECSKVIFIQENHIYSDSFVEQLEHNLNTQRQNEVEGYYWELVGTDECDELHLVGAMIDKATVTYKNETLRIEIIRNCE